MMSENAPIFAGQSIYESLVVLEPRSTTPWCIGPSLYMWLLWLEPLPALRNENIPAIRRLDLCMVTV